MRIEEPEFQRVAADAISRVQLWSRILKMANIRTMVEIGVWKGEFAKHILDECESIVRYYMIDPWANLPDWNKPANVKPETFDEIHREAMRNTEFASSKRVVLRGRTKEVIDRIEDNSLDFAYIDGDHTLRGITIDLMKVVPKIKDNGLVGGDDFTSNPWQHDMRFEPTLVCPFSIYFAEAMGYPIVALPFRQFLMQKRDGASFSFVDTTGKFHDVSLRRLAEARKAGSKRVGGAKKDAARIGKR